MTFPRVRWKAFGDINIAGSRLRAHIPIKILSEAGWDVALYDGQTNFDIIVFQKTYTEEDLTLAQNLKAQGKIIAFDLCDNHFYNPENNKSLDERAARLKRMLNICHSVIVSSQELARYIDHSSITIIDDAVESPKLNSIVAAFLKFLHPLKKSGKTSLVWFGNSGSANPRFGMIDLQELVPVLNEINKEVPILLNVISDSKKAYSTYLKDATFETQFVQWKRLTFQYLLAQNDLCLIPIQQNPFTICKTANRVILSLQLGVPVVADFIPSYEEFMPFIRIGDWRENILLAINDQSKHKVLNEAKVYIQNKYNDDQIKHQWSSLFSTIVDVKAQLPIREIRNQNLANGYGDEFSL